MRRFEKVGIRRPVRQAPRVGAVGDGPSDHLSAAEVRVVGDVLGRLVEVVDAER